MGKADIRSVMLARRRGMSVDGRAIKSKEIVNKISALEWFSSARIVAAFVPIRGEVDLRELIPTDGKTIVLPLVQGSGQLSFHAVNNLSELHRGSFGIQEPDPKIHQEVAPEDIDLILVPGLAFSRRGERLGYGGGFYDRILSHIDTRTKTLGIAFDFQITDPGFSEQHDVPVNGVLTERRILFVI